MPTADVFLSEQFPFQSTTPHWHHPILQILFANLQSQHKHVMAPSQFDILLSRNVPHILESIFLSLDYESFKECFQVSNTWNRLLKSEIFRRMAKDLFHDEILEDEQRLYFLSYEDNLDEVKKLINCGMVKLNFIFELCPYTGQSNSTPLSVAAHMGHLEVEQLLLEGGAIPDETYKELNQEKLCKAAKEGKIEEVTRLLSCEGLDKDCIVGEYHSTPLKLASDNGHKHVVKLLLQFGADPNKSGQCGFTPLYNASSRGHSDMVKILLDFGADTSKALKDGWTPLHTAAKENHKHIVQLLLNRGADPNVPSNLQTTNGCTPLHFAAFYGHSDVVSTLLNEGAEINNQSKYGLTALHAATGKGLNNVVQNLLDRGANPNLQNATAGTPLHVAAYYGHRELAVLLLNAGADPNLQNAQRSTPLHWAAWKGDKDLAQILLDRGANPNAQSTGSWTPLHYAAQEDQNVVVQQLLHKGAQPNITNEDGNTPWDIAMERNYLDIALALTFTDT